MPNPNYSLDDMQRPQRRSAKFAIDPSMPDPVKAAYTRLAAIFRGIPALQQATLPRMKKVQGNRDLTDDARGRQLGEIRAEVANSVKDFREQALTEVRAAQRKLRETVSRAVAADPMPDLDTHPDHADRGSRIVANRIGALTKMLARQNVDQLLDRIVASKAGDLEEPIDRLLRAAARDPLMAWQLEHYGQARIEAEGSEATRKVFAEVLAANREALLGEPEKLSLDFVDWLEGALQMAEATCADAGADYFFEGKTLPGILGARVAAPEFFEEVS